MDSLDKNIEDQIELLVSELSNSETIRKTCEVLVKRLAAKNAEIVKLEHELSRYANEKIWIVYYGDHGDREDCSVHYSWLVVANDEMEAIQKVCETSKHLYPDSLSATEHNLIR